MARIVIVGAGVGGLGTALCVAGSGHDVVIVERDDAPTPAEADSAFAWDRRGAPQVRHSHAFLARLRNLLRDRHPEVLDALFDAGITEMDFIEMMPEGMDRTPREGDGDLVALASRRTTFEWVLRHVVMDAGSTELIVGRSVRALRVVDAPSDGDAGADGDRQRTPTVVGVTLDDGTELDADIVVDASGRRSALPTLLAAHGVEIREDEEDTGIVYFSRFFQLAEGAELPPQVGAIGGDLGYLKYGVFTGDERTFSITLASGTDDEQMRRALLDPESFLTIAGAIPVTAPYLEPDRSSPITDVHVMARLLNRRRRFTDDDNAPLVLGLHAVGDAHTCTNPIYGRGCTLAMVQAQILADELDRHGLDHLERARAYESASDQEVLPWYRAAVNQDRLGRIARAGDGSTGSNADGAEANEGNANGDDTAGSGEAAAAVEAARTAESLIRDGLMPAVRSDPLVLRAFLRMMNMLDPPEALMANTDVITAVMQHYGERDSRDPEPPLGPGRTEMLERISRRLPLG